MSANYAAYAPHYDGSGQIRFAILFGQYLTEVLERHPAPGLRALDLACGTGTLAVLLADSGWDVTGVDLAPAMLALALAKTAALETAGAARFVLGDIRALPFGPDLAAGGFDLVSCAYDSLNYLLSEAELAAGFAGVARALRPGGLFVCDMNTRHFLHHDWPPCELDERPGLVQVQVSAFDPATDSSAMRLIGFVGDDAGGYRRFEELHTERAYPDATVAALLAAAGLTVEAAYDCFTFQPPHARSQRLLWVARKLPAASV